MKQTTERSEQRVEVSTTQSPLIKQQYQKESEQALRDPKFIMYALRKIAIHAKLIVPSSVGGWKIALPESFENQDDAVATLVGVVFRQYEDECEGSLNNNSEGELQRPRSFRTA